MLRFARCIVICHIHLLYVLQKFTRQRAIFHDGTFFMIGTEKTVLLHEEMRHSSEYSRVLLQK